MAAISQDKYGHLEQTLSQLAHTASLANGTLRTADHNINIYYLLCDTITCFNFKSQQFQNYLYSNNEVNNFTDVMIIIIYPGLNLSN